MSNTIEATIEAAGTFSSSTTIPKLDGGKGFTFTARGSDTPIFNIVIQRRTDGINWDNILEKSNVDFNDDDTLSYNGIDYIGADYRFGIPALGYTSGTLNGIFKW